MKYNTKPIDFTGCHQVIAEHLKRGEAIECRVWNYKGTCEEVLWVVSYWDKTYVTEGIVECDVEWEHAEPIPIKVKRIMPPERAIPVLIAEGWKFNSSGQMYRPEQTIQPAMFCRFGTPLDDPNTISWSWPPCIIEEVEDDE